MSQVVGPQISVVIPVYNVDRYLGECLDSVVNQTLANIEIICIDDGSTDGSRQILEKYASLDDRIRVVSKENEGQSVARNLAVSMARGDYIVFVDSDDIVDLTLCQRVYGAAERNLADVVVYDYLASSNPLQALASGKPGSALGKSRSDDRHSLLAQMGVVWTKCVRAGFFREYGISFPAGRIYEDVVVH
jgi:glycosyltransferase involved in cell wall biosynthesis